MIIEKTPHRLRPFGMKHYLKNLKMAQDIKQFNLDQIAVNLSN